MRYAEIAFPPFVMISSFKIQQGIALDSLYICTGNLPATSDR